MAAVEASCLQAGNCFPRGASPSASPASSASRISLNSSLTSTPASLRLLQLRRSQSLPSSLKSGHSSSSNGGALSTRCDASGPVNDLLVSLTAAVSSDGALTDGSLSSLFLAVGVGLPCTVMQCGDVIYRSTLAADDQLRLTVGGVLLLVLLGTYMWATPGVVPGFFDMFVYAPIERKIRPQLKKSDVKLGRKLGEGAYGSVFRATIADKPGEEFVVKKASEFGAAELWMNERVRRACPQACADFVDGFLEKTKSRDNFWIVWRFEGNATFADVLQDENFPYNVEKAVLGYVPREPKGPEREMRVIRTILKRILKSVDKLHSVGIVHRDIKPQNMIFNSDTGMLKIIDLGAAADLRVGINYNPNEFLLDPRYAAPEQYIMSTQTPKAPPPTIAALLSPVLWQMNLPDRFDMYSVGIIFLQMVFSNLRTDSPLIQFNRQLKRCDYDLAKWREVQESRTLSDAQIKAFAMLDADGGHGWSLLQALVNVKPGRRISAAGALAHPFFYPGDVPLLQQLRLGFLRFLYRDNTELSEAFGTFMSKAGTDEAGGFTEASLMEFKKRERKLKKSTLDRNALASMIKASRKVSRNVASTMSTTFGSSKEDGAKKEAWWNRWQSE
ncbi:unnamed protein product [Closterium sp. Yama58-4]|nr:unnamed protein product [Closterium sp. Yama58-4]